MKIKICGLNIARDVQLCIDLKVNFLGFVFFKKSPRNINLNDIKNLIMEGGNTLNEELPVDTDDPAISNLENENHSREPVLTFDNIEGHISNEMDSMMPVELSNNTPESCVEIPREMQTNMPPTDTMNQIVNNTQNNNFQDISGFDGSMNFSNY